MREQAWILLGPRATPQWETCSLLGDIHSSLLGGHCVYSSLRLFHCTFTIVVRKNVKSYTCSTLHTENN